MKRWIFALFALCLMVASTVIITNYFEQTAKQTELISNNTHPGTAVFDLCYTAITYSPASLPDIYNSVTLQRKYPLPVNDKIESQILDNKPLTRPIKQC